MRYLLIGIITGAVLGLTPLWQADPAIELYPEWHGPIATPESIERSPNRALFARALPPIISANTLTLLAADGRLISRRAFGETLFAASGNGGYYAAYQKLGAEVEFFAADGSPFWKSDSREYPHLSYNGKIVLLVNSDQTRVRALDFHGNQTGEPVSGRFLTVLAFSKGTDIAALGFLDGSYHVIDSTGRRLLSAGTGGGTLIKSIAVSPSGAYVALHYGNERGDYIAIIATVDRKASASALSRVHVARTALTVLDDGTAAILDYNRILVVNRKAKTLALLKIPAARTGMASLDHDGGIYVAGYTRSEGGAQALAFLPDGTVLFARNFPIESYLQASLKASVMLLRGSQTLYCYSLHHR
ncbi:MAG TPA: hypothetical protein VLM75_05650 [Spirochaetota bacterium]|nr:hypothetical protein [Spirochaetota bacterium]